jgi:hypothetical protein
MDGNESNSRRENDVRAYEAEKELRMNTDITYRQHNMQDAKVNVEAEQKRVDRAAGIIHSLTATAAAFSTSSSTTTTGAGRRSGAALQI